MSDLHTLHEEARRQIDLLTDLEAITKAQANWFWSWLDQLTDAADAELWDAKECRRKLRVMKEAGLAKLPGT